MAFTSPRFEQVRAARYKLENGRIYPASTNISEIDIDNDELLEDYLDLVSTYVREAPTVFSCGRYLPVNSSYEMRKYRNQMSRMSEKLLDFCNKWGLFGLIGDQALILNTSYSDGSVFTYGNPTQALVYSDEYDRLGSPDVVYPFEVFAERFFPGNTIPNRSNEFFSTYSESVSDILHDPRFHSVAKHINGSEFMLTERIGLILGTDGEVRPGADSLNAYCQILYLLDQMKGQNRKYEVCNHCKTSFKIEGKYRKYCSDTCMVNERSRQYRKRKKEALKDAQ